MNQGGIGSVSNPVNRDDRFHQVDRDPDQRTPGQRDRDRILYTSAFRRLAGITQVVAPHARYLVHNRLTHTLEVAQVSRRIAEKLATEHSQDGLVSAVGGIDPDVAEAAALAHDLGHPPFGHVAEDALDELALRHRVIDGFNGNAQSFRIVTQLAVRHEKFPGLNLTRACLDAILKYPWFRQTSGQEQAKWGAYHTEQPEFEWARAGHPAGDQFRSIEAEIMDWSDDIAFAVHDVEDFYRSGAIPLDRLVTDPAEFDRFLEGAFRRIRPSSEAEKGELVEAFKMVAQSFPLREPYAGNRRQRAALRSFTAILISQYINGLDLSDAAPLSRRVILNVLAQMQIAMLKQLTWHYVIDRLDLATQQFGQRRIVETLFEIFVNEATSRHNRSRLAIFPTDYRERLDQAATDEGRVRTVIDHIASMTEQQATTVYQRLTGSSPGSPSDLD